MAKLLTYESSGKVIVVIDAASWILLRSYLEENKRRVFVRRVWRNEKKKKKALQYNTGDALSSSFQRVSRDILIPCMAFVGAGKYQQLVVG